MKRLIGLIVATLALGLLFAVPASAHNTGSINALQPAKAFSGVYGRAQYVRNDHPSYKVTAWLQRRVPGGTWSGVTSSTRVSSDGYASTSIVTFNCRYDYRSQGEGWAYSSALGYHAHAVDLTSAILFHSC